MSGGAETDIVQNKNGCLGREKTKEFKKAVGGANEKWSDRKGGALPQREMGTIKSGGAAATRNEQYKKRGAAAATIGQYRKRGAAAARIGQYKKRGRCRSEKWSV